MKLEFYNDTKSMKIKTFRFDFLFEVNFSKYFTIIIYTDDISIIIHVILGLL